MSEPSEAVRASGETTGPRLALVTGGNRGIGAAIAQKLSQQGFKVILTYNRGKEAAESHAQEIGADAFELRLEDGESIQGLVRRVQDDYGDVQVLVHNAGMTRDGLLALSKEEDWDLVQQVNLKGPFLLTRALLKGMIRQRWGRVISLASASGVIGHLGQSHYGASKGGLIAFTKSVALEVARYGITANSVAPGFIDTDMLDQIPPAKLEAFKKTIPLRRLGRPDEVAELVGFLASDAAAYMTGQTLRIDGGLITA
ncbi:MAG: 3-oxoacyl-ACP reductase FabG [Deltaproteobacteria bacterium]|nr:3-oxoacyl-ACP reductase FabG [Deltaproteobacteria bacterium]